ncbi:SAC3/GANP/Nin1/mts3/eIF-3 p25 family-domain-containing protein [Mycena leptocephala]|nr:SAC3/GANP/Nin1/mts3/eIF-3 p25 family-domain-containing protein [Mycena leptocephala]
MSLKSQCTDLKASFQSRDLAKCGSLLTELKLGLVKAGLLLPRGDLNPDELVVTREIIEIGAFLSIYNQEVTSFDRYVSQLQTFYTDYTGILPPSQHEYTIRGLHLLRLLTQNRIADFHTALESLSAAAVESPYIAYPVKLEGWLMEGSYAKVWRARAEIPATEYEYFVDSLVGTIRNEIARCQEMAYDSLQVKDAVTLLFFTSQSELLVFAQERGWEIDLTLGIMTFAPKGHETMEIPKERIIAMSLQYTRDVEQII